MREKIKGLKGVEGEDKGVKGGDEGEDKGAKEGLREKIKGLRGGGGG